MKPLHIVFLIGGALVVYYFATHGFRRRSAAARTYSPEQRQRLEFIKQTSSKTAKGQAYARDLAVQQAAYQQRRSGGPGGRTA